MGSQDATNLEKFKEKRARNSTLNHEEKLMIKSKDKALDIIDSQEVIRSKIYVVRGHKVMLDRDLAELYGVKTFRLNEQVKRNLKRFPNNYMFKLTRHEYNSLRSQFAILKRGQHSKYLPLVFTEHGIS